MRYPKIVRVGHKTYALVKDKGLVTAADVVGVCGPDTQEIRIDAQIAEDTARETVLHEIMHAIWNMTLLDKLYTDDQEEQVMWAFSPLLLGVLRDNPALVKYLTEKKNGNKNYRSGNSTDTARRSNARGNTAS